MTARSVDIGDIVDASGRKTSKALFVVSDVHMMRIYVDVPQAFLGEMKEGLKATLQLPGMGETFQARLLTTSNAISEQSDNQDSHVRRRPGILVNVHGWVS